MLSSATSCYNQYSHGNAADAGSYTYLRRVRRTAIDRIPTVGRSVATPGTSSGGASCAADYTNWKKLYTFSCINSNDTSTETTTLEYYDRLFLTNFENISNDNTLSPLLECIDTAITARSDSAANSNLCAQTDECSGATAAISFNAPPLSSTPTYVKNVSNISACVNSNYSSRNTNTDTIINAALKRVRSGRS